MQGETLGPSNTFHYHKVSLQQEREKDVCRSASGIASSWIVRNSLWRYPWIRGLKGRNVTSPSLHYHCRSLHYHYHQLLQQNPWRDLVIWQSPEGIGRPWNFLSGCDSWSCGNWNLGQDWQEQIWDCTHLPNLLMKWPKSMTCQYATICFGCYCGTFPFRHVRNLYQGSISPCSATWTLKTRSRTEEQLSNGFAAEVFYFSKEAIAQLFFGSGTSALRSHLPWMRYLLSTAVSLEASIQDPPSDTFWWIEGCAPCNLFGVSVLLLWNGKRLYKPGIHLLIDTVAS